MTTAPRATSTDFSDPLRPVAVSAVDRLFDPDTYEASVSYAYGAGTYLTGPAVFGSADGKSGVWFVPITEPKDGGISVREVLVSLNY